ncbi:prepilin-type N-terminal cleavage/methylation domain-containing protein [Mesoterricola silvestris]|uniref:Prepilin-type N-terminal cleavage/methylation domain-containing protein n=1 Tax=Mesoterricola silvestris TaxID=2927979 RepID=A0AA48K8E6_9BACT|nr:prepilin-type N-terminal cleavage/methylation domain-containing protein [Mesoterricola silvestris]BDU72201.1 hypothetical protein METEAL_13750 [Mesoterricola silvestris]
MKNTKGFTLVEAAVAIGVVAVLSGIIIPLVLKSMRDAKMARARNDLMVIAGALAHQMKDTGTRPRAAVAGGGPSGAGDAVWYTEGRIPEVAAAAGAAAAALPARGFNTLENLLSVAVHDVLGNALFGFPARVAGDEFGYKGPYLAADAARRTDPWGNAYVILGYNANGQASGGPIWVVSAGEGRTILDVNLVLAGGVARPGAVGGAYPGTYPTNWNYNGQSETNLAVRVN